MRLDIKDFGTVHSASIKCNGLTVIAGENDTGKSTVGKLIFSIIKAVSKFEDFREDILKDNLTKRVISISDNFLFIHKTLEKGVSKTSEAYLKQISNFSFKSLSELLTILQKENNTEDVEVFIKNKKEILDKALSYLLSNINHDMFPTSSSFSGTASMMYAYLDEIKKLILNEDTLQEVVHKAFKRVLVSEFKMEITPKNTNKKTEIKWYENEIKQLDVSIKKDKIIDFQLEDILSFDDVTFIESPIILQLFEIIDYADTLFDIANTKSKAEKIARFNRPKVTLHLKDLMNKLKNAQYFFEEENTKSYQIALNIQKIISGKFDFNSGDSDFLFSKTATKNKPFTLKSINTASGIKAFGMIQLLILSGIIDHKSLIVIDEPETHLHPKWQVDYARILVELVKNDIKVLVTSHSPYFIQAVKFYAEAEGLTDKVNYYLAERNDNIATTINDVTDDLNQIFYKLSEPLQNLVWQQ